MDNIKQLIDSLHLQDVRNDLHPSIFDDNEEYNMLILRLPIITENELNAHSLSFILTKDESYYYNKEKSSFEKLDDLFMGPHTIANKLIDKLLKSFLEYQEEISVMEEKLYASDHDENFLNNWLSFKLEILRIERILLKAKGTMDEFIEYYSEAESFPMNHYVDLDEHIERVMRSAAMQLSKLDYLYSFYNAKSNDKMNKMIYILTIISAIFLPLNLVVGFFGMNTSGLPFAEGTSGTVYAISLMASLAIVTSLVVLKWRKKVEK